MNSKFPVSRFPSGDPKPAPFTKIVKSAAPSPTTKFLQLVQSIKPGNLVGFCERGIVEDRVAEIVHRAAEGKYGLTDVHDFSGAFTDHVDAEDLSRVRVKENFQHSC